MATVAIDGAVNAALLAVQILSVEDESLAEKLAFSRAKAAAKVLESNREINEKYSYTE